MDCIDSNDTTAVTSVADKRSVYLTDYVIELCRKFKIFPSERTTVVTHNEEMQILQYCSALHNKKTSTKFDASPRQCEKMHSDLIHGRIAMLEARFLSFLKGGKTEFCSSNSITEDFCSDDRMSDNERKQKDELSREKEDSQIEKETEMEFSSAVKSLFFGSLRSSNHVTLLEVYEKFLDEIFNKESKLHAFIQSDFKMDINLCGSRLLQNVEVLTMKILKIIAGADKQEECEARDQLKSSQATQSVPSINEPQDDDISGVISSISSPAVKTNSESFRSVKTPVQVFKSRHHISSPLPSTPITPSNDLERQRILKKFIENIFRCYLHILVNTRCELALAFVFNIPERELDHEAFTHLKHASAASGLSMYQTMSSMLMRVRLGGNGYAPPSDSPLLPYIKGLGCLFDFVDKLQTIFEESVSPRSGCKRVVNILKRSILMCKSRRFPSSVVESVASELWESLDNILSVLEKAAKDENSKDSESEEGIVVGQESINAFQKYLDQSSTCESDVDCYFLGDVRLSKDTPTRFPCLMSRFRSPLPTVEEEEDVMDGNFTKTNSATFRQPIANVSEALYLDNDEADKIVCTPLDLNNIYVIPSKTIVHPKCGADYGETSEELFSPLKTITNQKGEKKRGPNKRKTKLDTVRDKEKDCEDENSPQPKSVKNCKGQVFKSKSCNSASEDVNRVDEKSKGLSINSKKQNKSCRRKLLPQIKGQSKLTGFFKV